MKYQQISPIEDRLFKFSNEKNGKKYNWEIKLTNDSNDYFLDINITDTTNIINSEYQKKYSKKELDDINRFFKFFDDMDSIFSQIETILKNGKYEFYENDKSIKISLKTDIITIREIELDIPIKEKKVKNITNEQLYNYIKETEERVKIHEKENKEIKKENQEIKKIINQINNNSKDIQFNKEQYEKELNTKINKTLKDFQNDIEKKINNIDLEKNQLMKTQINTLIQNYSNNLEQIIGSSEKEEDDNNSSKIEIMNEKIEKELSINSCKFIMVDNIKIKNIGKKSIKNLYFVKDDKESSKDIIFISNDRNNNLNRLSLDGELEPSTESSQSLNLKINSPKNNNKYILIIYIREKENGPNLSNPLKIVFNVKESEEERKKRQEEEKEKKKKEVKRQKRIDDLFTQLNEAYDSTLIREEIEKIIIKCNFDPIKISDCISEKEKPKNIDYKGLNKDDIENLYKDLDEEFNISSIMDKKEVINKIIELKLDREAINNWIFEKL